MDKEKQYEEQLAYIREYKDEMFSFLKGVKIGLDLNLPIYFISIAVFELRKKFSFISEKIYTESFAREELGDIMNSVWNKGEEDFSLRESLKAETKLTVITQYIREIRNEKVFPSEVRRKEKTINNIVGRAQQKIDDYFSYRDVTYLEVCDIIDIYEVVITDKGKQVDLHLGRFGLTLGKGKTSEKLLSFVDSERVLLEEKKELVRERNKRIDELMNTLKEEGIMAYTESALSVLANELPFSNYALLTKNKEQLESELKSQEKNLQKTVAFFRELEQIGIKLPENTRLSIHSTMIKIGDFEFSYGEKNAWKFKSELKDYQAISSFATHVVNGLSVDGVSASAVFKDNLLKIVGRIQDNLENRLSDFRRGIKPVRQHVSMVLTCEGEKLYRLTREEVLTPDVILFEMMEKIRNIDAIYLESVQRAKEMFLSTLTEEEEKLMLDKGITILEGEKNYYALLNARTFNNVVKIPKVMKTTDDIKALCIHPEDSSVPMYDGFAAISFAVKAGDEEYVLENSNEFNLGSALKTKVAEAFNQFIPDKTLSFS